ncbi:MAG: hypothetical protein ABI551_18135 [Polyangiaceae bacterium]
MPSDTKAIESSTAPRKDPAGVGRIGIYSLLGGATGTVPLPWLPDAIARRLRGALAQDVASRRGLSLTKEARDILSEPEPREKARGFLGAAIGFATKKLLTRFTPLTVLPPLRSAAHVFALGHLFDRYIQKNRDLRSVRIDLEEAKKIRRGIDHALRAVIKPELEVEKAPRLGAPEDLRDASTQMLDGVIIAVAGLPEWLVRRLDAAFDDFVKTGGLTSAS